VSWEKRFINGTEKISDLLEKSHRGLKLGKTLFGQKMTAVF
jgi:hypothetical protein